MMYEEEDLSKITEVRPLIIQNDHFTFGNVEAWMNILASYALVHPEHKVTLYYDGLPIHNLISLYKRIGSLDITKFEMQVAMPDREKKNLSKLRRLLMEGASSNFGPFINKERNRVLMLF
ncbi:MAG: hypothetical protein OEW39_09610 [Deltaproteobacteria bacterium]|nr:hypothetical protein [Deltaproteobacteria bacterium]